MLGNQHIFTRRAAYCTGVRWRHLAVQSADITFQRKMTPTIGTMTAFLTHLDSSIDHGRRCSSSPGSD